MRNFLIPELDGFTVSWIKTITTNYHELLKLVRKVKKIKMPLRLQNTKLHKEQTINTLNLVNTLSLGVFVAKITFRRGLMDKTITTNYNQLL